MLLQYFLKNVPRLRPSCYTKTPWVMFPVVVWWRHAKIHLKQRRQSDRDLPFQTFHRSFPNLTVLTMMNYLAGIKMFYNFSHSADSLF